MEKEIKEYLDSLAKTLNGQIRGAINQRAREENLELIGLTLYTVFAHGVSLGEQVKKSEEVLDSLKKQLGIKEQQLKIPFTDE